jgi:hypothetical protein
MPLVSLQRLIRRLACTRRRPGGDRPSPETLAWAVTVASRHVPEATCLVRSLVVQALFEAYGWPARLRVGFARAIDGTLEGHAWVEGPDQRLIGIDARRPYVTVPLREEIRPS